MFPLNLTKKWGFPFKERDMVKADIIQLLEESGIGLPKYYRWRSRSGCFFCFFQRKYEWVMLAEEHPDLFAEAVKYEQKKKKKEHKDGRKYTWIQGESLLGLLERKDEIILEHRKARAREEKKAAEKKESLAEVLESVLDDEDDDVPCFACHL